MRFSPVHLIKQACVAIALICFGRQLIAQTRPAPSPAPGSPPARTTDSRQAPSFDLSTYGVSLQPDTRLIVMMAALDAAGFDPTPAGKEPSFFRAQVRKDQAGLDPSLRQRLRKFFELNRLPAPANSAEQAARYVSLAFAMGPAPLLDPPERSEDLPAGVLEVLDFAPLVREFYRKSGIDERLVSYVRAYQAEGDRLRPRAAEMVRAVLSYLHTRPITVAAERVRVESPGTNKKKKPETVYATREHERRFFIVPDLLAAPGAINFREIADDYYAIAPEGTDPTSLEMCRAYLQYTIDPLVGRFNRQITAQRQQIRQLTDERTKAGETVSTDVFLTVSRSLVAAAEARFAATTRLEALSTITHARLERVRDDAGRAAINAEDQSARAAIADEATAQLAEDYEKGAVLDFYFADQLRDFESSGFDIVNFLPEILAGFDPARESKRLSENAAARDRALAARKAHPRYSLWLINPGGEKNEPAAAPSAALLKHFPEIEKLLQLRNYEEAEARLKALLQDFPREPRIFFTLGQTESLWARDTTDDDLQIRRLNNALANYHLAVASASKETDLALLSRAHEAMARILAFLDRNDEAVKEFDEAIRLGQVAGGAYDNAVEGRKKLAPPQPK